MLALYGPSNSGQTLGAESWLSTADYLFRACLVPPHAAAHVYAIKSAYMTFKSCSADCVRSTSLVWGGRARDETPCCLDEI